MPQANPGFRGTVIDILNEAEKAGWIKSAETWKRIRELRNITAHEYSDQEARELYAEVANLSREVLCLKGLIGK